ncbi:MAG: hypothetical protein LBJ00_06745 [Planctomycetaceae bacterium]|nr:hypothetical protein [Planctomycetaceae bacterium]
MKRLFKGEAYRPTGYGIFLSLCKNAIARHINMVVIDISHKKTIAKITLTKISAAKKFSQNQKKAKKTNKKITPHGSKTAGKRLQQTIRRNPKIEIILLLFFI